MEPDPEPVLEEGEPPEPEPATEEAEPPEPEPAPEDDDDYKEYVRHGVSVAGLRHTVSQFGDALKPGATTSDLCQLHIKPHTVPAGWTDEPEHIREDDKGNDVSANGWYKHQYVCSATGAKQSAGPDGTRSMCQVLKDDPSTAHFVGRPTIFLSHAWLYLILSVLDALELFVAALPEGAPEPFFWFDCFSLDQHAQSDKGSEWWRDCFLRAIGEIGHTVMVLSPWDNPIPLTRAWCLWELYCTHKAGARFSVCVGSDQREALERAVVKDFDILFEVFSKISVEKATASNAEDETRIKEAVREEIGFRGLDAIAFAEMREWVFGVARNLARTTESLLEKQMIALLFYKFGLTAEAKRLYTEVIEGQTATLGANHTSTLLTKGNLAQIWFEEGETERAKATLLLVVEGFERDLGPEHSWTQWFKGALAECDQ